MSKELTKVNAILEVIKMLVEKKEIDSKDAAKDVDKKEKVIKSYFDEIYKNYQEYIPTTLDPDPNKQKNKSKNEKKTRRLAPYILKLKENFDGNILNYFKEDYRYLTNVINSITKDDEFYEEELKKVLEKDKDIFVYKNQAFKENSIPLVKKNLKDLKIAVDNNEYRKITYLNPIDNSKEILSVKCLKLIYTDNNWYLAVEWNNNLKKELRLLRLAFMQEISYDKNNNFQASILEKYEVELSNMQNAMTLLGKPKFFTATLKANKHIAFYFKEDMKKFFSSQKFISQSEDGSIKFSVEYTQPLEILPFVKKWLPSIEIIAPQELIDTFENDLELALKL